MESSYYTDFRSEEPPHIDLWTKIKGDELSKNYHLHALMRVHLQGGKCSEICVKLAVREKEQN